MPAAAGTMKSGEDTRLRDATYHESVVFLAEIPALTQVIPEVYMMSSMSSIG